jgi:hypothetical protein
VGRVVDDVLVKVTKHMLATPNDWPIWPVLPIKRYANQGDSPEMGYVLGDPVWPLKVYAGNIYEISTDDPIAGEYTDAEGFLDAGWVVD